MSKINNSVVKPHPRRKVVSVECSVSGDAILVFHELTLECGHKQFHTHLKRAWKPPKTTLCYLCGQKESDDKNK